MPSKLLNALLKYIRIRVERYNKPNVTVFYVKGGGAAARASSSEIRPYTVLFARINRTRVGQIVVYFLEPRG